MSLDWPGNVRQLENTCRWLTVMASGREIHLRTCRRNWVSARPRHARRVTSEDKLARAAVPVGAQRAGQRQAAYPARSRARLRAGVIEVALAHTRGRKRDAAELLGWGRNTLTRKMKELEMDN
jgi:two-component system nitrogen regulation response regulator GlnG